MGLLSSYTLPAHDHAHCIASGGKALMPVNRQRAYETNALT
jgi:hypothetical protein